MDSSIYKDQPKRHPDLIVRSQEPFNAEPQTAVLVKDFLTPNHLFYVRNHLPVPKLDAAKYVLEIDGIGVPSPPIRLSLDDIKKKFEAENLEVALQCAGNRRDGMESVKHVKGITWGPAAISNAKWTGPKLVKVLRQLGVNIKDSRIQHVQFESYDSDGKGQSYGASIPAKFALKEQWEVMLAYKMNDESLPPDHGFPLRIIAPGIVGARHVKWLKRIILSEEESQNHWQQNDYKLFSPNIDWDKVDFKTQEAVMDMPVQSVICDPQDGENVKVHNNELSVRGYAYSGGGRPIARVDVTPDGGDTWITANLVNPGQLPFTKKQWTWTLWEAKVPLSAEQLENGRKLTLSCRAVDSSFASQPQSAKHIWNLRGILNNSWYSATVTVQKVKSSF